MYYFNTTGPGNQVREKGNTDQREKRLKKSSPWC